MHWLSERWADSLLEKDEHKLSPFCVKIDRGLTWQLCSSGKLIKTECQLLLSNIAHGENDPGEWKPGLRKAVTEVQILLGEHTIICDYSSG